MMTTNDVAQVLDTILSIPGMNEVVKIDLRVSRKNVLLLDHAIRRGLAVGEDGKDAGLLAIAPKESLEDLHMIAQECLQKAGMIELSEKLIAMSKAK